MPKDSPAWLREASNVVAKLPNVSVDHELKFFEDQPHLAIRVRTLDGVGIVHRQRSSGPFSLCVFEPSPNPNEELAEVFGRHMTSLDQLPEQVAAWLNFRRMTSQSNISQTQDSYHKIVQKSWRWKTELATRFHESSDAPLQKRWSSVGIDVDFPTLGLDWSAASRDKLLEDVNSIVPELLAWHLPCDETGQWFLKRKAPLYRYEYDKRRMLDLCLVLVMPDKRSSRARLTTEWLGADSQSIRLDATPELFDGRLIHNFGQTILGNHSLANGPAASGSRGKKRTSKPPIGQTQELELLDLQYAGEFAKACKMVGLELDDTVVGCMAAKRVSHMCTCCGELDEQLVTWSRLLKQTLLSLNTGRLVPLLIRDQATRARPRKEPIPILPFPLQRHTRKAHLAVDLRKPDKPRLTIDTTGSMNRVPMAIWRRPIELDAMKLNLTNFAELPNLIRQQFGTHPSVKP